MEMPCPGAAEVSGNSWVLAVLVGETPGTSSARSRKFLPFMGRLEISAWDTVPEIWVRDVSSKSLEASMFTVVPALPSVKATGRSKAEPTVRFTFCVRVEKPSLTMLIW